MKQRVECVALAMLELPRLRVVTPLAGVRTPRSVDGGAKASAIYSGVLYYLEYRECGGVIGVQHGR